MCHVDRCFAEPGRLGEHGHRDRTSYGCCQGVRLGNRLGPEAGKSGGELVYQGPPEGIGNTSQSVTARYLLEAMEATRA